MSERARPLHLTRLLNRGSAPTVNCQTAAEWQEEYFAEQCRWACQVDNLEEAANRYWREALQARAAWSLAACGWVSAVVIATLWWRSRHG